MDNNRIGELIKKKRKEMGWTQAQLAERLFVSTNAVSKWELGKNAIDMEKLKDISQLLNIPMPMLVGETPEAPESDSQPSDSNAGCPQPNPDSNAGCPQPNPEADTGPPGEQDIIPQEGNDLKPGRRPPFFLFAGIGTVLAAAVVAVCLICLSGKHSFEIQNEYFDTYEGQKACFLIADYKGKLTADILIEYSEIIEENYSDYFTDVEIIVILFYRDSRQQEFLSEETADAISYLFPDPILTPAG